MWLLAAPTAGAGNAKVTVQNSEITYYGVSDAEQAEIGKGIRGMISVPWVQGLGWYHPGFSAQIQKKCLLF